MKDELPNQEEKLQLLPCPCCGQTPVIKTGEKEEWLGMDGYATLPTARIECCGYAIECKGGYYYAADCETKAIEKWNDYCKQLKRILEKENLSPKEFKRMRKIALVYPFLIRYKDE